MLRSVEFSFSDNHGEPIFIFHKQEKAQYEKAVQTFSEIQSKLRSATMKGSHSLANLTYQAESALENYAKIRENTHQHLAVSALEAQSFQLDWLCDTIDTYQAFIDKVQGSLNALKPMTKAWRDNMSMIVSQ